MKGKAFSSCVYLHVGDNSHCKKIALLQRNFCCNKLHIVAINLYCHEIFSLLIVAIKFVIIDYCNKNFVVIEFCCNKRFLLLFFLKFFLLLLKILYCNKKYCCYNLLQEIVCCDRLLQQ